MDKSHEKPANRQELVDGIVASYMADDMTHHLDATFLPNRARIIEAVELLRGLIFPGFFDEKRLTTDTIAQHVDELVGRVYDVLYEQTRQTIRYEENRTSGRGDDCEHCDKEAARIVNALLEHVPEVRRLIGLDIRSSFEGDPAAISTDETIFCYPGVDAIFTYRIAHELWKLGVPLLARIMTEYAHNETGIDIHPGADIGESFFIDHGTGVVIGETCQIGNHVKIYQGVTLGALSTKGGQDWRGRKRHPTIEDDVTIYGGAIILGGGTVIGRGAVIGGSVFLTSSVPAEHTVTMNKQGFEIRPPKRRKTEHSTTDQPA